MCLYLVEHFFKHHLLLLPLVCNSMIYNCVVYSQSEATSAKMQGDIRVGDEAVIGSHAVVLEDVPAYSVVVGIPAKVIKTSINLKDFY
ncbi:hypothetical protein [Vibrio sp. 1180_3]|uniref:hypothetical protein n=1 Tax=Vibrio sp. 1180_3 TaxID=2528832 RepID=UPI00240568D6|nr:hypothetical protein [Vibrio sp. 1180_3]MDF9401273.1 hypothetical protein [Vibrio sp. 1180_3]